MRHFSMGLIFSLATLSTMPATANDREIARQIANVMRISGAMEQYDVAIKYKNRTAFLRGDVATERQMKTALEIAQASPHVDRVVNHIDVIGPAGPRQNNPAAGMRGGAVAVSGISRQPAGPPVARQVSAPAPVRRRSAGPIPFSVSSLPGSPQQIIRPVAAMAAAPLAAIAGGPNPAYVPGTGGGVAPATYDQPQLPGYAWPSYAAYPNYAALTYPKQYSPTAWPYIGPFYPYPQVPLGWRKVTLEWDDGWWMLDFKDH